MAMHLARPVRAVCKYEDQTVVATAIATAKVTNQLTWLVTCDVAMRKHAPLFRTEGVDIISPQTWLSRLIKALPSSTSRELRETLVAQYDRVAV